MESIVSRGGNMAASVAVDIPRDDIGHRLHIGMLDAVGEMPKNAGDLGPWVRRECVILCFDCDRDHSVSLSVGPDRGGRAVV